MKRYHGASSSTSRQAKPPGNPPSNPKPTPRALPPTLLCDCRDCIQGPTFTQGERLAWPTLAQKTLRVFPRSSNPLTPCVWGQREIVQDARGHIWELHHLEIKECLPAPSHMPMAPGTAPRVLLRGESATRMSDALEGMMNLLDQLPRDWRPRFGVHCLPIRAEGLAIFARDCSICGLPRRDLRAFPSMSSSSPSSYMIRR